MKKLMIMGAFALLSATLFSCTADEYETADTKGTTVKSNFKPADQVQADNTDDEGPGDDPIIVPPPPPKKG
ncbi:hypothetical protein AR687_15635 [Flavobacteriaceae bacterium CRH]|nr:hypothetical protein AR687_15635 [Flavobacteriaceae bacterium CRH]